MRIWEKELKLYIHTYTSSKHNKSINYETIKTNIISLIENLNGLRFQNIYIYTKSLYQLQYCYLRELINPIKGFSLYTFSENEQILNPAETKQYDVHMM